MTRSLPAFLALWTASALFGADPWVEMTSPRGDSVGTSQVEIACRLASQVDAGTLRVEMDGVDLTAFVNAGEGTLTVRMPGPLSDGPHELVVSGLDNQRIPLPPVRKKFSVRVKQRREVSASGALSGQYNGTLRHEHLPDQEDTQSGLAQGQVSVRAGAAQHDLNVTTIYNTPYPMAPSDNKFDLSSATYGLRYEKETTKFSASAGQISYDLSPLTLSGYASRGGSFHLEAKGIGLDVFSLDTRRPFGWSGNIGPGSDTDDHINGFRLQARMPGAVEVYGMYLKGAEPLASSYNIGTEAAPVGAEVAGLGGKFGSGRWSGLAEITQSRKGNGGDEKPRAYRLMAGAQGSVLNLQVSFQRVEEGYSTPGVPYLSQDREDAAANVQFSRGKTMAGLSLGYQQDNLSGHGYFPALRQWRGGITANQGLGAAWNLNFSYSAAKQGSDTDGTFPSQDLLNHSASAGLSLRSGAHFIQYGLNFSRLDDQGPNNSDNQMYGHQLTYMGRAAAWLDVSSSLQYSLVRPTMQDDYGRQTTANLDFRTHFLNNALAVDFGGSWNRSRADDHADATEMSAYHLRFGYLPLEKVKGFSQSNLALDFRQTRMAFAGQTQTTLQVLLSAGLNLSGRHSYAN